MLAFFVAPADETVNVEGIFGKVPQRLIRGVGSDEGGGVPVEAFVAECPHASPAAKQKASCF